MPQPRILQAAWEDISEISDRHLAASGPHSAQGITDRILNTIDLLESTPYLGPLHHDPKLQRDGYRKLLCDNYVCIYRIIDEAPVVYRVFNSSRNYSWRMR